MKRSNFLAGLFLLTLSACSSQVQTMVAPITVCAPTLILDATIFQMETIQLAPDGSVTLPSDDNGVVYWVNGTDAIFIFILSPTPENLAVVSTLKTGSLAKATWSNCVSITYILSAPKPGSFGITYLPDQTTSGIQIFLRSDTSENDVVINGEALEE